MKIKLIAALLPIIFLLSCGKEDTPPEDNNDLNPDTFVNDLKVTISGAKGGSYHITGDDVGVGCIGFTQNRLNYFSIGFGDYKINFSTGIFFPDVTAGKEQDGVSGQAKYGDGTRWEDVFSSQFYWLYYQKEESESLTNTWITINRFESRVDEMLTKVVHIRLTGTFRFKASNSPEKISEAAILDAWNRGENGTPIPLYLPELAGTSKIEASGSFDIMFTTFIY